MWGSFRTTDLRPSRTILVPQQEVRRRDSAEKVYGVCMYVCICSDCTPYGVRYIGILTDRCACERNHSQLFHLPLLVERMCPNCARLLHLSDIQDLLAYKIGFIQSGPEKLSWRRAIFLMGRPQPILKSSASFDNAACLSRLQTWPCHPGSCRRLITRASKS